MENMRKMWYKCPRITAVSCLDLKSKEVSMLLKVSIPMGLEELRVRHVSICRERECVALVLLISSCSSVRRDGTARSRARGAAWRRTPQQALLGASLVWIVCLAEILTYCQSFAPATPCSRLTLRTLVGVSGRWHGAIPGCKCWHPAEHSGRW